LEEEQRQAQFARLAETGQASLAAKDYERAVADLGAALKLRPEDAPTAQALKKAQAELDKVRQAADRKKARADADAHVKKAREASRAKHYDEAVQLLRQASKLVPNDPSVKLQLDKAEETAERARRHKARQEADALVEKGRKALEKKHYEEAVTALSQALKLVPTDRVAKALLKTAREKWEPIRMAAEAERKQQEEARRGEQLRQLLASARSALKANKLDEAAKALAELSKLNPKDPEVAGLLKDLAAARKARADEAAAAARKKRLEDYRKHMQEGNSALAGKKYEDAIRHYSEALRLVQGDKEWEPLAKDVRKALEDARAAKAKDPGEKLKLGQ